MSALSDMRDALQMLERGAQTSSAQRKARELAPLVEKAEALSERDARFQRESTALMVEFQGAIRVLRRNPHNARARSAANQLDARLRSSAKAWKKSDRAQRAVERRAARLLAGP